MTVGVDLGLTGEGSEAVVGGIEGFGRCACWRGRLGLY